MRYYINLEKAQYQLMYLWMTGTALSVILLITQSVLSVYKPETREVWSWFLPMVIPTMTLMLGALGASMMKKEKRKVKKRYFKLAFGFSIGYMVLLLVTILLRPLSELEKPMEYFSMSNFWLGSVQSLVLVMIGYFFNASEAEKDQEEEAVN